MAVRAKARNEAGYEALSSIANIHSYMYQLFYCIV